MRISQILSDVVIVIAIPLTVVFLALSIVLGINFFIAGCLLFLIARNEFFHGRKRD